MLKFDDITISMAGRRLIDHASATLPDGFKTGFTGHNGTGKSTLFRAITGELALESGSISYPKHTRIGQVAQEAPGNEQSLIEIVLEADLERAQLLREAEISTDPLRIAEIHTRLADIHAHSAESRAASILHGLGFDHAAQQRPVSSFSGGWRMRVALAAVLFIEPDLLLLDEPTNYLDLEGTLWLIDYIKHYRHNVLIISHDRDLLNAATTSILHLDQGKLTLWSGNYDQFERQRAETIALQQKQFVKQEAHRKHMESFVERFRYKATKAKQAQSRLKALEKLQPVTVWQDTHVQPFRFPTAPKKVSSPIVVLDKVSTGYDRSNPILKDLDLRIDHDDRIALLGSNGNGKSTFAKLLAGRLEAFSGTITKAPNLKVAFFAQHQIDDLYDNENAIQHVARLLPQETETQIRSRIAQMGLSTEKMLTKAKDLSGGEKARLLMGLATLDGPHLLILDEPTNHLDIDSRTELINALNAFEGAVILIAHDRHLIDATIERLWLVKDGSVQAFDGDMENYRRYVLGLDGQKSSSDASKPSTKSKSEQRKLAAEKRALVAPLRKKIQLLEEKIAKLQSQIKLLDKELGNESLYVETPEKATQLAKKKADIAKQIEEFEEQWLTLQEDYETAMADDGLKE